MKSPRLTPNIARHLSTELDHASMSSLVYATTIGLPVVPLEACRRTMSLGSAANIP